jgi:hypothetical protein
MAHYLSRKADSYSASLKGLHLWNLKVRQQAHKVRH